MTGLYEIHHGSAHQLPLPNTSIHTIITSPPYFGLRVYAGKQDVEWPAVSYAPMAGLPELHIPGCDPSCVHEWVAGPVSYNTPKRDHDGPNQFSDTRGTEAYRAGSDQQRITHGCYCRHCGGWRGALGAEPTIEMYIGHLVLCLREWSRVLRDDGTVWVNLGDAYANDRKWGGTTGSKHAKGLHGNTGIGRGRTRTGLPAKSLMGIPWRFAFAAQAEGWILRRDIVWAKGLSFLPDYAGSVMPESVTDRPSTSHEYVFILAKREKYFYDQVAVAEPAIYAGDDRRARAKEGHKRTPTATMNAMRPQKQDGHGRRHAGFNERYFAQPSLETRNLRSVFVINPANFKDAHFAVFPEALVEPMIKASTSARGVCPACGAPYMRTVERVKGEPKSFNGSGFTNGKTAAARQPLSDIGSGERTVETVTTGWRPTCDCDAGDPIPATVLDPFVGSGTTLRAAIRLGRRGVGVDISKDYLDGLVANRLENVQIGMGI